MNKILTIMVLGIFLIGIGSAMSNNYLSNKDSIGKNDMSKPTENSITSNKRSSNGGSFVTLWVRKDSNLPCVKSDVITIKGIVISGKHGVAVNYFSKLKEPHSNRCPITDGKPLPIGWWNPRFMKIWNGLNGGLIE